MKKYKDVMRRAGVILIAIVVGLEFIPMIGGGMAFADDNAAQKKESTKIESELVELSADEVAAEKAKAVAALEDELGIVSGDEIDLGVE